MSSPLIVNPLRKAAEDTLVAYGLATSPLFIDKLIQMDIEVLVLAIKLAPVWKDILIPGKNPKVVLDFVQFLTAAGKRYALLLDQLAKINTVLWEPIDQGHGGRFKDPIRTLNLTLNDQQLIGFIAALANLEATKLLHLKKFLTIRGKEPVVALLETYYLKVSALVQDHGGLAFEAIALTIDQNGYTDYINDTTICGLALMSRFKLKADFTGVPGWGPGDHGDPDSNLDGHFSKHVMGINNLPLLKAWEMAEWWRTLALKLSWDEYAGNCLAVKPAAKILFTDANSLPAVNFLKFAELDPITGDLKFQQLLQAKMKTGYRNFTLAQSANLTEVRVHGNEKRVFLSGFIQPINLFIIARFEGVDFGISSAYFVPADKINEKLNDRLAFWVLK